MTEEKKYFYIDVGEMKADEAMKLIQMLRAGWNIGSNQLLEQKKQNGELSMWKEDTGGLSFCNSKS